MYTMCAAILVVSKEFLAFLPNIELVSFLLIVYALNFRLEGVISIAVLFSGVQMVLYGVGMWTPMYFIVWSLLGITVYYFRNFLTNENRCAIFSGGFGLVFGFLFSIPYFIVSLRMGWIYFLKGIPFDLIHCIANYIIMLVLFNKVNQLLGDLSKKYNL
ncbi:hypothetical protein [Breznakia pachnodae]|uniref:Energy-coupling factor transport system substrate-specific component n=1 Tax=Breznakia pachnodae TaxID=265178 RepID=A0ABU0E6B9_9FIRM|nr:hypothetical protein [Breznakia pachnodae]MDQ0362254.1 energy-coupling factor transport system substrate-specific component [Breznakia pachnodae]